MEYRLNKNVKVLSNELDLKEYLPYVKEEVKIIKENFNQTLINTKLNVIIEDIDGEHEEKCIYGLLTGSCFSPEAHTVIFQLLTVVESSNKNLEGYKHSEEDYSRGQYFLSPIEHYITPTQDEIDMRDVEDIYPDSYYERIKKVLDLLKE